MISVEFLDEETHQLHRTCHHTAKNSSNENCLEEGGHVIDYGILNKMDYFMGCVYIIT